MNKATERKRLRREYLQQRAIGNGMMIAAMMIFPVFGIITLVLALITFGMFVFACLDRSLEYIGWMFAAAAGTTVSGWLSWLSLSLIDRGGKIFDIPYVPPVTPATLPADEILVRSADEPPVAQSDVLLRAAPGGREMPKEELLRVSQE